MLILNATCQFAKKMIGNPFVVQFSHVLMYSLHKYALSAKCRINKVMLLCCQTTAGFSYPADLAGA